MGSNFVPDIASTVIADLKQVKQFVEEELIKLRQRKREKPLLETVNSSDETALHNLRSLKSCVEAAAVADLSGIPAGNLRGLLRTNLYRQVKAQEKALRRSVTMCSRTVTATKVERSVWRRRIDDLMVSDRVADYVPSTPAAARKEVAERRQQIRDFLNEYYMQPSGQDVKQFYATFEGRIFDRREPMQEMLTADDILTDLLEAGHTRYIQAGPGVWCPHLECFLRSGVATRHPNQPDHFSLSNF